MKKLPKIKALKVSIKPLKLKKKEKPAKPKPVKIAKGMGKIKKVMGEFSQHKLHSGSKKGPLVINPKQALAIGYSEKRRAKK